MVSLNRDALTEKVLAGERISVRGGAGIISLAAWRNWEYLANARRNLAKAASYDGRGARDRDLHCRSKHQLHQCLQRLLQVLRVLSNGER